MRQYIREIPTLKSIIIGSLVVVELAIVSSIIRRDKWPVVHVIVRIFFVEFLLLLLSLTHLLP